MKHPEPPIAGDEIADPLGSLARQRATLAWNCGGLDAAGMSEPACRSSRVPPSEEGATRGSIRQGWVRDRRPVGPVVSTVVLPCVETTSTGDSPALPDRVASVQVPKPYRSFTRELT